MRERFSAAFAIQPVEGLPEDSFAGMASVFGSLVDAWIPTRISSGAFTKTLQENKKRIKVLYQHNTDQPIGVPIKMEETSDGLYVEAKISKTVLGSEVLTLIRDNVLTELSIGFDPIKFEMVEEQGMGLVRHIKELRLWEFSPVTFAADPNANINSVHAALQGFGLQAVDILALVAKRCREQHEGKVLSAKNKTLVQEAITALQTLLDAAEPPPDVSQTYRALTSRHVDEALRSLDMLAVVAGSVKGD